MPKCITDRYILNFSIPLSSTERENTVTDVVAGMRVEHHFCVNNLTMKLCIKFYQSSCILRWTTFSLTKVQNTGDIPSQHWRNTFGENGGNERPCDRFSQFPMFCAEQHCAVHSGFENIKFVNIKQKGKNIRYRELSL